MTKHKLAVKMVLIKINTRGKEFTMYAKNVMMEMNMMGMYMCTAQPNVGI
ncbi:MAG: hypothetical protein JJE03_05355 [Peptostreptococcaceae bacterium]|nr:hypothetical protein [Peptostreptococcaceae bacterium]